MCALIAKDINANAYPVKKTVNTDVKVLIIDAINTLLIKVLNISADAMPLTIIST